VVMSRGEVQQVGAPQELYDFPVNLFVAGFIGSPAMNFIPATLTDHGVESVVGPIALPDHQRILHRAREVGSNGQVLLGVRPEHFADATLMDPALREQCKVFDVTVDFVESMGSDKYYYFTLDAPDDSAQVLHRLAEDIGATTQGGQKVARLLPTTAVPRGRLLSLAVEPRLLHVFDVETGLALR